jgi:hypothetical protein
MAAITPAEIIANVADKYDRPDLVDKLSVQFQSVLREAHGIEVYTRDLELQYVANPFISSNKTSINSTGLAKSVRRIVKIETYNSFTGLGTLISPYVAGPVQQDKFRDMSIGFAETDYYGFKYDQTWAQLGSTITINGVNQDTTMLGILALVWPTYTYNTLSDLYETDSWIMLEWPGLIEAILSIRAMQITQNTEALGTAQQMYKLQRQQFITAYSDYTLCL